MFSHESVNGSNTSVGGRWSHGHLYSPKNRYNVDDDVNDLGEVGFINFAKFFTRAFHGVPILENVGRFTGKIMNVLTPITWIREDVRKQVLKDSWTFIKRTPQMAVGAVTGFAAGGPWGAAAGAAIAATKKGEGFKFKVVQSGVMPGLTGAGVANFSQALSAGWQAGAKIGSEQGVSAGFQAGKSAFSETSTLLASKTVLGQTTTYISDVASSVPSFIKTSAEVGFNVAQATGYIPGGQFTPGAVLSTELFKGVVAPVTQHLMMSSEEREFLRLSKLNQGGTLTAVGYDTSGQAVYTFSGLTFDEGVEGVVRNRVTNEIEIDYSKLPSLLASTTDNRVMSDTEINVIKNQFINQVASAFESNLKENYLKTIRDMYRTRFDEQLAPHLATIRDYKSKGGAYAQEAARAESEIEKSWNEQWMPSVEADTKNAVKNHLPVLLEKHAEAVFVDSLKIQNRENSKIRKEKMHAISVHMENIRNRNTIPAMASNKSRLLAAQRAKELDTRLPELGPQPEFLAKLQETIQTF